MKWMKRVTLAAALAFSAPSAAMTMQELFDEVNAMSNVTDPSVLQGQTMNIYSGGSLFMRAPKRTYQLATVSAPSWGAGCGGIDLYLGGLSYISKDQFVQMLRNIGSNALGYSFKLAIQNLCPTCDNVMQALQATAQAANRLNIDSCEAAKGIVNAALPDSWTRGKQNAARSFGVSTNTFEDVTDAWLNVMKDEKQANAVLDKQAEQDPTTKDHLPTGNVVWKALKKLDALDDEQRMVLMSLVGTVIFPAFDATQEREAPIPLEGTGIDVEMLVGIRDGADRIQVPIWRCDRNGADECLRPQIGTISTKSFRAMVREKMGAITDNIAMRRPHENVDAIVAFLNSTDLPIYKMLAVSTSLNNPAMADLLTARYEDLIAAKYAQVYIERAATDLRAAIRHQQATADATQSAELEKLKPVLDRISMTAKQVLTTAYAQTTSTYNLTLEVQHIERAFNANLSQSLRSSLTFGKSMR